MPELKLDKRGRLANYKIVGAPWSENLDFFHWLMHQSVASLLVFMFGLYSLFIIIFALCYYAEPLSVRNLVSSSDVESFYDAFFFSVHTFSTIGYGSLVPQTHLANVLTLVESFAGLAFAALFAGVFFAKLSAPKARVAFSKYAVTQPHDGKSVLLINVCNQRYSQIVKAQAQASVMLKETTLEGQTSYTYKQLKLEQPTIPVFIASWQITHVIDESSPLHGLNATNSKELGIAAIHAVVDGVEEVYGQPIFERQTFLPDNIKFNHNFVRMFEEVHQHRLTPHGIVPGGGDTQLRFHLDKIHEVERFNIGSMGSAAHMLTRKAKEDAKAKRRTDAELEKSASEIMSRICEHSVEHKHEGVAASGSSPPSRKPSGTSSSSSGLAPPTVSLATQRAVAPLTSRPMPGVAAKAANAAPAAAVAVGTSFNVAANVSISGKQVPQSEEHVDDNLEA